MSFIPFPSCCEAAIQFVSSGIPGVITLGFKHTGDVEYTPTSLGDLATVISTQLVNALRLEQTNSVHYTNIHLRDLGSVSGAVFDLPLTATGSQNVPPVQNQVAMTVTFLTGVAGRSYRGRNYLPSLPAGSLVSPTTWDSGLAALLDTVYETFDLALPAVDSQHCVLSRFLDKSPRVTGHAQPVIGYRANTPVYTQRRRLT